MMQTPSQFFVFLVGLCLTLNAENLNVNYTKEACMTNDACGPDHCCVVGFYRYSIPSCLPMGDVGDWCRMPEEEFSSILLYPNSNEVFVKHAYLGFCPCMDHLQCSPKTRICREKGE